MEKSLCDKISHNPVSHRAGRWAMDDRYFEILKDFGITTDCSFTPGVNWESSKGITGGGSNYTGSTAFYKWYSRGPDVNKNL